MLITSINNQKVKNWKKLKEHKYREETGLFIVEGMHLVLEAYKKGVIKELILEQDEIFPFDVDIVYVTKEIINTISELVTPVNIMAVCQKIEPHETLGNRILIIDGIQDPGNLGTMIRSAVAFDVDTIILGEKTVDLYNSKCIRASQGMLFHINIINKDLLTFLPILANDNYLILGTRVTHGKNVKELTNIPKFALVMGNEGSGISEEVQELCDEFIYIKMNENCESLNVSIACSIILYQLS
ncbi:MAG: RNA methyltransferase [Bacilli bacterium]|jgi:TrmH family RNA methyltransferase|nr:RNA methyltransferase [Bacilli bacterium]